MRTARQYTAFVAEDPSYVAAQLTSAVAKRQIWGSLRSDEQQQSSRLLETSH